MMRRAEADNTVTQKYRAEVAKRSGITENVLGEIVVEGLQANWPMP